MPRRRNRRSESPEPTELRIIGGTFRGRKLTYEPFNQSGDPVTRPMKHRTREAIFNLVSTAAEGRHAIDLFAGTGALGLEAISRGAVAATFIEKHVPTAKVIEQNIAALAVAEQSELLVTSAFLWGERLRKGNGESGKGNTPQSQLPWLVFCSPPYQFYVDRKQDMLRLVNAIVDYAPEGSVVVVEADERFDMAELPGGAADSRKDAGWDVRRYPPAVVAVMAC